VLYAEQWPAFVAQVRRLMANQSVTAPKISRLVQQLESMRDAEQAARGMTSTIGKARETMSEAELDAAIAARQHLLRLPRTCPHCLKPLLEPPAA
jgi:hypothetical protein